MGVLAHEIGHLRSGDVLRTRAAAGRFKGGVLLILGAAGIAAGQGEAGAALCMVDARRPPAPFWLSAAGRRRRPIKPPSPARQKTDNRRVAFMTSALRPAKALLDTDRDTYARTHPHSRDRLATIERALTPARDAPAPRLAAGFARLRAKLTAYLQSQPGPPPLPASNQSLRRDMPALSPPIAHTKPPTLWPARRGYRDRPEPVFAGHRGAFQWTAATRRAPRRAIVRRCAWPARCQTRAGVLMRDLAAALLAGNSAIKDRSPRPASPDRPLGQ